MLRKGGAKLKAGSQKAVKTTKEWVNKAKTKMGRGAQKPAPGPTTPMKPDSAPAPPPVTPPKPTGAPANHPETVPSAPTPPLPLPAPPAPSP